MKCAQRQGPDLFLQGMKINGSSQKRSWELDIPGLGLLTILGFHLEPTYKHSVEHKVFGANRAIYSDLAEQAASSFFPRRNPREIGVQYPIPSRESLQQRLPKYLCMALVRSVPIKDSTYDEDTLWSEVVCCWFTDSISQDINSMILAGIRPFAWEKFAKNGGV